jgi:hypothetical protein
MLLPAPVTPRLPPCGSHSRTGGAFLCCYIFALRNKFIVVLVVVAMRSLNHIDVDAANLS